MIDFCLEPMLPSTVSEKSPFAPLQDPNSFTMDDLINLDSLEPTCDKVDGINTNAPVKLSSSEDLFSFPEGNLTAPATTLGYRPAQGAIQADEDDGANAAILDLSKLMGI